MVAKMGKSGGLMAALGDKGRKAVESHKNDETKLGGGGDLPAGVEGKAQLVECKFSQHEKGEHKGKWFFYAAGIVLEPGEVLVEMKDGTPQVSSSGSIVNIEGRRTSVTEPIYDTPTRSRTTVDDHIAHILNHFRLLGVDTSGMKVEQMESVAEALKKAKPNFNFRTWCGKPATEGKYKGQPAQVQHDWRGVCDDVIASSDGVNDQTGGDEPSGNGSENVDLDELARLADQDGDAADEDAQTQLTEIATAAGIDEGKISKAKNWTAVVKMIRLATPAEPVDANEEPSEEMSLEELGAKADEGDDDAIGTLTEEAEKVGIDSNEYETWSALAKAISQIGDDNSVPELPAVGDVRKYRPIGKDQKPAKKAVKVEIVAVFEKTSKVNLKNLEDGKTSYKAVPFDALEDD